MKLPIHQIEKEKHGIVGAHADSVAAEEKIIWSIEALLNGGDCEQGL